MLETPIADTASSFESPAAAPGDEDEIASPFAALLVNPPPCPAR
jgi:hypothetical protein